MKKNKLIYQILLISIVISLNSCSKKCGGNVESSDDRIFTFRLIDSNTNETAISDWGTKYDSDEVQFKLESNDTIRGLRIGTDGTIAFYFTDEISANNRQEIVDKPFSNKYFLYLNEGEPNFETDIDTIIINSGIVTVDRECTSIDFGKTTITYNDSIYNEGGFIRHIDFIKNN